MERALERRKIKKPAELIDLFLESNDLWKEWYRMIKENKDGLIVEEMHEQEILFGIDFKKKPLN